MNLKLKDKMITVLVIILFWAFVMGMMIALATAVMMYEPPH